MIGFAFAILGGTLFGFLAGLLSFKVKQQWCEVCGNTLGCLECATGRAPAKISRSKP